MAHNRIQHQKFSVFGKEYICSVWVCVGVLCEVLRLVCQCTLLALERLFPRLDERWHSLPATDAVVKLVRGARERVDRHWIAIVEPKHHRRLKLASSCIRFGIDDKRPWRFRVFAEFCVAHRLFAAVLLVSGLLSFVSELAYSHQLARDVFLGQSLTGDQFLQAGACGQCKYPEGLSSGSCQ